MNPPGLRPGDPGVRWPAQAAVRRARAGARAPGARRREGGREGSRFGSYVV